MAIIDHVCAAYRRNLNLAGMLVADLSSGQMVHQPVRGMNHAAWILGHLSMPRLWARESLGLTADLPAGWLELFNTGSQPKAGGDGYPTKEVLLAELGRTHAVIEEALRMKSEAELMQPVTDERLRAIVPFVGDSLVGLVTTHEAFHLGQLSALRRAMGMKALF